MAEERADGIVIRPATVLPVEIYTAERKAEFILNNAVGARIIAAHELRSNAWTATLIEASTKARVGQGYSWPASLLDALFIDANVLYSAAYMEFAGLARLCSLDDVQLLSSAYAIEEARRKLASIEARPSGA